MATLPGVRSPSRTGAAVFERAWEANVRLAYSGIHAVLSTPIWLSMSERIAPVRFTALTVAVTMGMPANLPSTSVLAINLSALLAPCCL